MRTISFKTLLAFIQIILFSGFLKAQVQEVKLNFGDVDISEVQMKTYAQDTSAAAVILGDYGTIKFTYDDPTGAFKAVFVRHTRIKILKQSGYEWADHSVDLLNERSTKQEISQITGTTYNLEDGKIKKSKLTKQSQFMEKTSENWNKFKFTMPDVKVGSVIEYKYTMVSDYLFTLPVWYFQYTIPAVWSELNLSIPEYYSYNRTMSGYLPMEINNKETNSVQLIITERDEQESRSYSSKVTSTYSTSRVSYFENIFRMAAKNVPAFSDEPYVTSSDNYISKVTFELAKTSFPGSIEKVYTDSWESINTKLLEHESFGGQLRSASAYLSDKSDELNKSSNDPVVRASAIFEYVKNYMKWNNKNSFFSTTSLRNAYDSKSGNIGDINLLLTVMLRKAGFDSDPVILSTRSNGQINPKFPILSHFNYVISSININGKLYLMDASDPNSTFNLLPVRCFNGNGLVISDKGPRWIELTPSMRYEYSSSAELVLDQSGKIEGTLTNLRNNYGAYSLRESLDKEKSEDDFITEIEKSNPGLEIVEFNYKNRKDLDKPMTEEYKIMVDRYSDVAGDYIYFNPLLFERIESNPFKLDERKYPIDYAYPLAERYTLNLKIPDGYSIVEVPKKLTLSLPENAASFTYDIEVVQDTTLRLTNELTINKPVFYYNEYNALKEFYNDIVQKHAESIVIKKK